MKNLLKIVSIAALTLSVSAFAADKEVTLTGEGKCAKCALKKSDTCQNALEVKNKDATKVYYLTGDVSKAFHGELCTKTKNVKVVGVASEVDGKHMIAVSKIEAVK
ncbi:MAG: hypothetical protein EXS36_13585 [Pedosphaera sp.]|nr:hypothetical protein [Pedosphaera sp.]